MAVATQTPRTASSRRMWNPQTCSCGGVPLLGRLSGGYAFRAPPARGDRSSDSGESVSVVDLAGRRRALPCG
jgi:hypothetical protein